MGFTCWQHASCEDWHLETGFGCNAKALHVPGVLAIWLGGCFPQPGFMLLDGGRNSTGALPFSCLSMGLWCGSSSATGMAVGTPWGSALLISLGQNFPNQTSGGSAACP